MDANVLVIAVPLGSVALAGVGLHFVATPWVRRISSWAILGQIAVVGAAWALLRAVPDEETGSGVMCPDLNGAQGGIVGVLALASVGIAAVALTSSFIVVRRCAGSTWRLAGGVVAAILTVSIFAGIVAVAFCGFN